MGKLNRRRKVPYKPPSVHNVEEEEVAYQNIAKNQKQDFIYILIAMSLVFVCCDIMFDFGFVEGAIFYTGINMHYHHINIKYINYGMVASIGLCLLLKFLYDKKILGVNIKIGSHQWCMNKATEKMLFENHAESLKTKRKETKGRGGLGFDWGKLTKADIKKIRVYYKQFRKDNNEDDTVDENEINRLTSTTQSAINWKTKRVTNVKVIKLGGQGTKNVSSYTAKENAAAQKNTKKKRGILMLVKIDIATLSMIIVTLKKFRSGAYTQASDIPVKIRKYFAVGNRGKADEFAAKDRDAGMAYVKGKTNVDGGISSKDIQSNTHEQLADMAAKKYRNDPDEDERSVNLRTFGLMKNKDAMDNMSDLAHAGHLACIPVKLGKVKNAHLLFSVVRFCICF